MNGEAEEQHDVGGQAVGKGLGVQVGLLLSGRNRDASTRWGSPVPEGVQSLGDCPDRPTRPHADRRRASEAIAPECDGCL